MSVNKTPLQEVKMDPAVQAYIGTEQQKRLNQQREKAMALSQGQRRKRQRDRVRSKATYDLPPEIKDHIEKIAAEYKIPKSQLAAFLLDWALRDYAQGKMDLRPYLRPSRVPRFEMFLVLPEKAETPSPDQWNWWHLNE